MEVWIFILAFVIFLGFAIAVAVCISAIRQQNNLVIRSRIHRKTNGVDIIFANVGLVIFAVLLNFHYYMFIPAILAFVLMIVLSTKVRSGITNEGVLVGTTFIDWEFIKGYKLVDNQEDSNIVVLKIRANRKQYVLVCNRSDRKNISEIMKANGVKLIETVR